MDNTKPQSQPQQSQTTPPSSPPSGVPGPAPTPNVPQQAATGQASAQQPPQSPPGTPLPPMNIPQPPKANKKLLGIMGGAMVLFLVIVAGIFFFVLSQDSGADATISSEDSQPEPVQNQNLEEEAKSIEIDDIEDDIAEIEAELENL